MSKHPALSGKEIIKALTKADFETTRQRGSHVFLKHPDGRVTVVPVHSGEMVGVGLLSKILRDADMTRDELSALLK